MAIGVVSDDDFFAELDIESRKSSGAISEIKKGRGETREIPEELRKVIIDSTLDSGRADTLEHLARPLGISESSVSAYTNGSTSTASYNSPNLGLQSHINSKKIKIVGKAHSRLMRALNELTPEKLTGTKARDLASIAKDMAAVVKQMEPEQAKEADNKPKFVIFAPRMRNEESYDVIEVKE